MLIFKALHILSMFTMVTLFVGLDIYYALAIQARNVRAWPGCIAPSFNSGSTMWRWVPWPPASSSGCSPRSPAASTFLTDG